MTDSPTLAQEFVLLASDVETHKWKTPNLSRLETYAAGAVLIELLADGVVQIGREGNVEVVRHMSFESEPAKIMFDILVRSEGRTIKQWIQLFYRKRKDRLPLFEEAA